MKLGTNRITNLKKINPNSRSLLQSNAARPQNNTTPSQGLLQAAAGLQLHFFSWKYRFNRGGGDNELLQI